jgi:hypothetical protein
MISFRRLAGPSLRIGTMRLTPIAGSVRLAWPRTGFGIVWTRPVEISIEEEGAAHRSIKVSDPTRQAHWIVLGAGLVAGLFGILVSRKKR